MLQINICSNSNAQSYHTGQFIKLIESNASLDTLAKSLALVSENYLYVSPDSSLYCALEFLKIANDPEYKVVGYSIAGISSIFLGGYQQAVEYEKKYLEYALQTGNKKSIGSSYNDLGMAYDYMGKYDSAIYYYKQGLIARHQAGDKVGAQGSLSNLGLVYFFKGDLNESLKYLFESYRIAEYINYENGISSAATNINLVYMQLKNFDKALHYANIAQEIFNKSGVKKDIALGLNNFGTIYSSKGEYTKALEYNFQSLKLKQEINDRSGIAMSYQNIGSSYFNLDSFKLAEYYLLEGKKLADSLQEPFTHIEINLELMRYYQETGQNQKAYQILKQSLSLYENELGSYVNDHKLFKMAGKIYASMGDYKNAYHYLSESSIRKDSVENSQNANILAQKDAEFNYEKKRKEDEFLQAQQKILNDAQLQKRKKDNYLLMLGLGSVLVVLFFVFKNNREKQKANVLLQKQNEQIKEQHQEISEQKQIIEEKNKDITDSIQYAKRLQDAILPEKEELKKNWGEYFVLYEPKDIVSGDFYWTIALADQDILFAVIDCTGHGVPGGFVSIIAHNALERAVKEFKLNKPSEILNKVNELIIDNFKQNKGVDIRDGMDIALCRKKGNKLYYSGANNPLWICDTKGKITEIKADKQPIGYYENHVPFTEKEFTLEKDSIIYLFSDGYADQFGGPKGKKFKYSQLKEVIVKHYKLPLNEQKNILHQVMLDWRGQVEQIDDICLLGIRNA